MTEPASNVPLTAEDAKLLVRGDWIYHGRFGVARFMPECEEDRHLTGPWKFLARPADPNDREGWVAHDQSVKGPVDGMGLSMDFIMSDGQRYDGQKNPNFWHLVLKWRPHTPARAGEGDMSAVCDQVQAEYPRILERLTTPPHRPDK